MKFGPVPVDQAEGKILAHNIARRDGHRAFRKGKMISAADVTALHEEGYVTVYVAELEVGDEDENSTAAAIARTALGVGVTLKGLSAGRANLAAMFRGVLYVDAARLEQVNSCEGVAFATLRSYAQVQPEQIVATVKIISYGVSAAVLAQAEAAARDARDARGAAGLIQVGELKPRKVGIIYSGMPAAREKVMNSFEPALRKRIGALGSHIESVEYIFLEGQEDDAAMAQALARQVERGSEVIILASETPTVDRRDIAPRSVESLGGQVISVGAPVDPGTLLMLAYLGERPVLGVPGFVRSPKTNVVDWVLPALLAGIHLNAADIARMGYGGLMDKNP